MHPFRARVSSFSYKTMREPRMCVSMARGVVSCRVMQSRMHASEAKVVVSRRHGVHAMRPLIARITSILRAFSFLLGILAVLCRLGVVKCVPVKICEALLVQEIILLCISSPCRKGIRG